MSIRSSTTSLAGAGPIVAPPMARLVTTVHGVPGLKAAMDLVGYEGGEPRPPLTPCSDEAVAQIRRELANLHVAAAVNR